MANLGLEKLRTENKTLKAENKSQKAEIAYLKAKIKHLYAEIIEIARYTVPVDAMPKDRTQEVSYAKSFIR